MKLGKNILPFEANSLLYFKLYIISNTNMATAEVLIWDIESWNF